MTQTATRRPHSYHTTWTALVLAVIWLPLGDVWLHIRAAMSALWARVTSPLGGHIELSSDRYYWCDRCDSPHRLTFACPLEIVRFCVDCNDWRRATRAFRCAVDERHELHPTMHRDMDWRPTAVTRIPSVSRRSRPLRAVETR